MTNPSDTARQAAEQIWNHADHYTAAEMEQIIRAAYDAETAALQKDRDYEKSARCYYQSIVYSVCSVLDSIAGNRVSHGDGVVCGTVSHPTDEVQRWMTRLVDELRSLRKRCEELEAESTRYGAQLDKSAELLTAALPIGEVKAIGRMEVASGMEQLTTERDNLRKKVIDLEGMLATAHEAGEKAIEERNNLCTENQRLREHSKRQEEILDKLRIAHIEAGAVDAEIAKAISEGEA